MIQPKRIITALFIFVLMSNLSLFGQSLDLCTPDDVEIECLVSENEAMADAWNQSNITLMTSCASLVCTEEITITSNYDFSNFEFSCGRNGSLTVTYQLSGCGYSGEISATISSIDTNEPVVTCTPDDSVLECSIENNQTEADAWNSSNITKLEACSTDDCSSNNITVGSDYDFSNYVTSCGNSGSITVTYIVEDECGNRTSQSATFSTNSTSGIMFTCVPEDVTVECQSDNLVYAQQWNDDIINQLQGCAVDNCSDEALAISSDFSFSNAIGNCNSILILKTEFTLTSSCGDTRTVEAAITFIGGGDDTGGDNGDGGDTGGDDTGGDNGDGGDTGGNGTGGDNGDGGDTGGDGTDGDNGDGGDTGGDGTGGDNGDGGDTGGDDTGGDNGDGGDTGGNDTGGDSGDGGDSGGDGTGGDNGDGGDTGGNGTGEDNGDGGDSGGDGTGGDSGDNSNDGYCIADGGVLKTIETDLEAVTVCVGDEISDAVYVKVWEAVGDNANNVQTDSDGTILKITENDRFEFEGTSTGVNNIYNISWFGGLSGFAVGSNIDNIQGCYGLSNPVVVTKVDSGETCDNVDIGGEGINCDLSVAVPDDVTICEGDEVTLTATESSAATCVYICSELNSKTLVSWDLDACYSITNGEDNFDFSEFTPTYPGADACVGVDATIVSVEGGMHSCTVPADGLDGKAMCISSTLKCYWLDDSADALKFSVTLNPEDFGTITGLEFMESAPERFMWSNPDFSDEIVEGPNNFPRFYGIRVSANGEEIFQQIDIATSHDWTLEEFDFSTIEGFRVNEATTFDFELLAYCPAWRNGITYAWDLDNIKLLGGCCEKDTTLMGASYEWSTGETTESITVSPTETTTYSVTLTDCEDCTAADEVVVTVNEPLTADLGNDITVCESELPITISHSTDGISEFSWSTGDSGSSIEVTSAGEYSITISDGEACSSTDVISVNVNSPSPINIDNPRALCDGETIVLSTLEPSSQSGGTWSDNDGGTVSEVGPGNYTYTYTDNNGCSESTQINISLDNFSISIDSPGPICRDATFDLNTIEPEGSTGGVWTDSDGNNVSSVGPGNYTYTVSNDNGCEASDNVTITLDEFSISLPGAPVLCEGEILMLINLEPTNSRGGTWTDANGTEVTKVGPGTYTYTVSNENGCVAEDDVTVMSGGFALKEIIPDSLCWGDSLVLADYEHVDQAGGFWKDLNNEVVTKGTIGTYNYHLFEPENGCASIIQVKIPEKDCPDPCLNFMISLDMTPDSLCTGETMDLASLEFSDYAGGIWKDLNNNVVTVVSDGIYTYNYFDEVNGCADAVQVTVPHKHVGCVDPCEGYTISIADPESICEDENIELSILEPSDAAGGTWTNSNREVVTTGGAGEYNYSYTNDNGCSASVGVTILVRECVNPCDALTISFDNPAAICNDETFNLTEIIPQGYEAGSWTDNDGNEVSNVNAGTYTFTVTTTEGCELSANINIIDKDCSDPCEGLSLGIDGPQTICSDETLDLVAMVPNEFAGGVWEDVDGNEVTNVGAGIYTYTVVNSDGCELSGQLTVQVESCGDPCENFSISIENPDAICEGESISLNSIVPEDISGGTWTDENGNEVNGVRVGTFTYTYTSSDNCKVTTQVTISTKDCSDPCENFSISIDNPDAICEGESISLNSIVPEDISGGTWTDENGNEVNGVRVGTYTYTYTSSADCTATTQVTISTKDCSTNNGDCTSTNVEGKYESVSMICSTEDIELFSELTVDSEGDGIIRLTNESGDANSVNLMGCSFEFPEISIEIFGSEIVSSASGYFSGDSLIYTLFVTSDGVRDSCMFIGVRNAVITDPCDDFEVSPPDLGADITICTSDLPYVIELDDSECIKRVTWGKVGAAEILEQGRRVEVDGNASLTLEMEDENGNIVTDDIMITVEDCTDPLTPCDDGNSNTENDVMIDDCNCCGTPVSGQVIYVDKDASGANDGSSWDDAFMHLQDALAVAESGQEVWIADGTYLPTEGGSNFTRNDEKGEIKSSGIVSTFTVTNLDDEGPGSLRQAFLDSESSEDDVIIDVEVEGTILLTTANAPDFNLLPNISRTTINGNGIIVKRDEAVNGRFFQMDSCILNGITFDGGISISSGGALFVTGNNVIDNCSFVNNVAGGGEGRGGAIRLRNGTTDISNSTFTNNSASLGAAILNESQSILTLSGCTITGNNVGVVDETSSALSNQGFLNMSDNTISGNLPEGAPDLFALENSIGENNDNQIGICSGDCSPVASEASGDRTAAFQVPSGVDLYGGFSGGETTICQRDFNSARSILSGDLDGNDKVDIMTIAPLELLFTGFEENSYHLIDNRMLTEDIIIDGIVLTGASATENNTDAGGAFTFVAQEAVTIEMKNVLILHNRGSRLGGAGRINNSSGGTLTVNMNRVVFVQNSVEGPELDKGGGLFVGGFNGLVDLKMTGCGFAQNYAEDRGGAFACDRNVNFVFENNIFAGNKAKDGGAIFENNEGGNAQIVNNTFYFNFADELGGAIVNWNDFGDSDIGLHNSIFFGNISSPGILSGLSSRQSAFDIQHSLFSEISLEQLGNNGATIVDSGNNIFGADPLFEDPINANFNLMASSPAINQGNNDLTATTSDAMGNTRIQDETVDLGAFESGDMRTCDFGELILGIVPELPAVEEYVIPFESEEIIAISEAQILAYPNPASSELNVLIEKVNAEDEISMQLFDSDGRMIPTSYNVVNDNGTVVEFQLAIEDLRGGVYLIKSKIGRQTLNKRVIIIK